MDDKINELVDEEIQNENWLDRFIYEYNYTKRNQENLGLWIQAVMNDEEPNDTGIPIEVYFAQYHAMSAYLACLELRAAIIGIENEYEGEEQMEPEVTD